jgi:uncharacterized protein
MSTLNKQFVIPFVGLSLGKHEFEYQITDKFFENREFSIINEGDISVHLELEKKETMMVGIFDISGNVGAICDKCGDPVRIEIEGSNKMVYKFGLEPAADESLTVLPPESFELDVTETMYEFITISLPTHNEHAEGECNLETLEILKQYMMVRDPNAPVDDWDDDEWDDDDEDWDDDDDQPSPKKPKSPTSENNSSKENTPLPPLRDEDIDPRWAALKKLK